MTTWSLIQIVVNIFLGMGICILWIRLKRPPQDDPRLSRGLQLLQSKISVLEDLSDRTEVQVDQLNALMEKKCRQVQKKVEEATAIIRNVDHSMSRSLEVAEIFQDKIPHEEIINRKNTVKYVKAARMAHAGASIEEISRETELPASEIEMITKINKDELMFDEESLPEWAMESSSFNEEDSDLSFVEGADSEDWQVESVESDETRDYSEAFTPQPAENDGLKELGEEFRKACNDYNEKLEKDIERTEKMEELPSQIVGSAKKVGQTMGQKISSSASTLVEEAEKLSHSARTSLEKKIREREEAAQLKAAEPKSEKKKVIKKVQFPQIGISFKDLK